jgi:RNA polymerase sigma factor (sigma-70 family)
VVQQLAEHIRRLAEERHKEFRYDDELDALRRCLDKLPIKSRAFVDLYYYSGVSTVEIASQMKMKSDTVCRALCRLRERLRSCIDTATS